MKKKIIFSSILLATVIALVIAMVLAVSACSSSETAPTNAQIENSSENTVDNNTSLESSFDNSAESKISEKSNIESSINSSVSSNSQNSKVENSKQENQTSSKPAEASKSSNTTTNSNSSNSKIPSNNSSSSSSNGGSGSSSSKPSGGNSSSSPKPSSGSSSSTPSHSHSYSSKTVKATCTSGGYTVHTCSCGASYTDNYTSATGHKWSDWKTVKKATTSSEGRKQRTCSSCGKTESKTIAKVQGSSTSGGHRITGARKAVYSYRGMDSFSSVNLVDLINAERAKEGLGKLEWTADVLTRLVKDDPDIADAYSDYFDSNGNFNPYIDPEVREPLEGAQKMANMGYATHGNGVGCHCVGASEGASTIEEALRRQIKAYMNSPEHRAILMNAGSHRVTAAYAIGSDGTVYTAILVGG
ncbi:MAG: CAP domain-containing protein [Ruminococcaceae bacterium]|nr:CAP domain-containing protein [Oscillospiraceae bacterium]